jgi:hypothetical protein
MSNAGSVLAASRPQAACSRLGAASNSIEGLNFRRANSLPNQNVKTYR